MTRFPKKRGITQDEEDKSLIPHQFDLIFILRFSLGKGEVNEA